MEAHEGASAAIRAVCPWLWAQPEHGWSVNRTQPQRPGSLGRKHGGIPPKMRRDAVVVLYQRQFRLGLLRLGGFGAWLHMTGPYSPKVGEKGQWDE